VLHSPGGRLALKNTSIRGDGTEVSGRNPFEDTIRGLMAQGVKFYFCQNTTRAYLCQPGTAITSLPKYLLTGIAATDQMIDGMEYTTAGLTSIADFQAQGYQYIQP
jgi:intracellular sulfur oxidation DsrE/DsrF family protein